VNKTGALVVIIANIYENSFNPGRICKKKHPRSESGDAEGG